MTITDEQLDSFSQLAVAIGLMRDGSPQASWFENPVGDARDGSFRPGLRTILADDAQRNALVEFVDEVLGPPDRETDDDDIWIPLFAESDPAVTISAVVTERPGTVWLGIGVEYETGLDTPSVSTRFHVPIFQLRRRDGVIDPSGPDTPDWLLLGGPDGNIAITVDATLSNDSPPAGEASLGGLELSLRLPTSASGTVSFGLGLRRLQLPGSATPQDFSLSIDELDELGDEVLDLIAGLLRAQADALDLAVPELRPFASLAGMLGLRSVPALPPLPLADLGANGVSTVVDWFTGLLDDDSARAAWLGEFATLVGAIVDESRNAIVFSVGPAEVVVGIRTSTGVSGLPVLTPWIQVALVTDAERGRVEVSADLFRLDTGTGSIEAIPDLRAEAVLGTDAGAPPVLAGDPGVETVRLGLAMSTNMAPRAVVTLGNVTLNGRVHELIDLSSPDAALDAVNDVVDDALVAALDGLGPAGDLVATLIGLDPPPGIDGTDATALIMDPLGQLGGYWSDLLTDADAMTAVLREFANLLTGGSSPPVPGAGTSDDPWTVELGGPVAVRVWDDSGAIAVDLAASSAIPVLDELQVVTSLIVSLVRVDVAARSLDLITGVAVEAALERIDAAVLRLGTNDLAVSARNVGLSANWSPARGFRLGIDAPELTLSSTAGRFAGVDLELPVPRLDPAGVLVVEPNWDDVEQAVTLLLERSGSPFVSTLLDLVGWTGDGARLGLGELIADADLAIRTWLADLVLDCGRIGLVLQPLSSLLNGLRGTALSGTGSSRHPFRCPVGGSAQAPGLAVWTDPGCPPVPQALLSDSSDLMSGNPVESAELVAAVHSAARTLPSLADLLVGRDGLADGLGLLRTRWLGSDGLVVPLDAMPPDVASVTVGTASYADLVAMGVSGELAFEVFDPLPTAIVHIGVEPAWTDGRPGVVVVDTVADPTVGTPIPAVGAGEWFVRLPGDAARQAGLLAAVLADRTDPVSVVAYGSVGATVMAAAEVVDAVDHVVTVGVPWGPVAVDALTTGLGADALRFLDLLLGHDADADAVTGAVLELTTAGRRMAAIVARCRLARVAAGRPPPVSAPARAGLVATAVFGSLNADAIDAGFAELCGLGIEQRRSELAASTTGSDVPTSLHVGVSLPPIDLDIAGLLVGAGATLEVCTVARNNEGAVTAEVARSVIVDIHFGVHDGWLVGGPGDAQHDLELRWMSARVEIPLDARPGRMDLTLHEVTTFGVFRERWDIGPSDDPAATVVPEVRALLSHVVGRLRSEASEVAALLEATGLIREGGLDPAALDRWVYDTKAAAAEAVATRVADLAAAIRVIVGDLDSTIPSAIRWSVGATSVDIDLATGVIIATASIDEPGVLALDVAVDVGATDASASISIGGGGDLTGGVRLTGGASTSTPPTLGVDIVSPGGAVETVALIGPDTSILVDRAARLASSMVSIVAAGLAQHITDHVRTVVSAERATALDRALQLVGLLGEANAIGVRSTIAPVALFHDPAAWFRHGVDALRTRFADSMVELLDLVGPLVDAGGGEPSGAWRITDELAIRYEVVAGRVRLVADYSDEQSIGLSTIATSIGAGLLLSIDAAPTPALDALVSVNGSGLHLALDPTLRLRLVRPGLAPLTIHPGGGAIGDVLETGAGMVAPLILDAIASHRADAASFTTDVAELVFDVGTALDLVESGSFTTERLLAFAADPAAALIARLPALAAAGLSALADALDPDGTLVRSSSPAPGRTRLAFGADDGVTFVLDAAGATPAVEFGCNVEVPGFGSVVVERLRVSSDGVQVAARIGPAAIPVGAVTLFPLVVVRAGTPAPDFTPVVGLGLATDATGDASLEFRWGLNAQPPELLLVTRSGSIETPLDDPAAAALQLLGWAASLAGGILVDELDDLMTDDVAAWLRGVVFTDTAGSRVIDASLFLDLLDPEALLDRLLRFGWNLATTSPPTLTIDGKVTIGLAATGPPTNKRLGVNLSLVPNTSYAIASGETQVDLVVKADWINPDKTPGLTIDLLAGTKTNLRLEPAVTVAGLGLRVSKSTGPLIDLGGVAIDAIAVHTYAEAASNGDVGGGIDLQFDGFAFAPSAGGGDNAVANSIMNDAGEAGVANRPAFSPALSIQSHPGEDGARVSVRAGDLPGPWWVVVQRQLGPLYVDRVGLDTVETNGRVTRISLLFDGSISMFGLAAAVDQLSLNWNGGDVLSIQSWSVDLMGLAISAEMSGVFLSGGLLKTIDAPPAGSPSGTPSTVSYVGMLMGRFGVYGLSVFGGYTDDDGSPSFFVFGALNGPIGGPPAFFVTGIGGGLGINRGLRTPDDLSQFGDYPFIKALDPAAGASTDPMQELRELSEYFPPERGNFWFAAGISFTSFALVDGVAVVAVSFGNGLDINLFGLARLALPRPQVALVSIELGILARFSTSEGLFIIQAQLTDNSWLLYPEVRLTGGFAMAIWWKGPLAGQFVLSLGGYHPDFHREGYPIVPRLGLEWRITDDIVIKGGSYFALTSEALMAGVDVEVVADWGWAWVRVAFGAHALVFFDPFFFTANAYARISAGIEIDVWIGTISFSISIGASIQVQGPEFSGTAKFEIGPCELEVSFGDSHKERTPLIQWDAFVEKYLEVASPGRARSISAVTGRGTVPSATDGERSAPTADGSQDHPFEVFVESEIVFVSTVPVQTFAIGTTGASPGSKIGSTPVALGLAPMGVDEMASTLTIRLERKRGSTWASPDVIGPDKLDLLALGLEVAAVDLATPHVRTDAFPVGVWGQAQDPDAKPMPKGDVISAGSVIKLVAGILADPVGPEIDFRQVRAGRRLLPLRAIGEMRATIVSTAEAIVIPRPTTAAAALDTAASIVFAPDVASAAVLRRGDHSDAARRSFVGTRTAPPLFGTLGEGIAAVFAERSDTADVAAPQREPARIPRLPAVIGHMAAGSGSVKAGASTTVGDGRTKRRAAPTVESVQSRLGTELPLRLTRRSPSMVEQGGVLLATTLPHTALAGSTRTTTGGRIDAPQLQSLVGGLHSPLAAGPGPRASDTSSAIRSGDVVVLEQLDAAIDVGGVRPVLAVTGTARVVMVRPGGAVMVDRIVSDDSLTVPTGVRQIAAQADARRLTATEGMAGWHGRSRLARVGVRSALGAGCVVWSDSSANRARVGWSTGAESVVDATRVTTAFSDPAEFAVIVLDGAERPDLDATSIAFRHARRATDDRGRELAPTVVLVGGQSMTFVPIVVDHDSDEGADERDGPAFVVICQAADVRRLRGVVAGSGSIEDLAGIAGDRGIDAVVSKILATQGPGCRLDWKDPSPSPSSSTRRRAAAKKTAPKQTAKKQAAPKKTAKQQAAKQQAAPTKRTRKGR